jgi:DNA repair exonuclease SbcCD ATPase subunit
LFFLAIIFNLIVINYKVNNDKQNSDVQKQVLDKVRNAEQHLNENIILTEEKISSQKIAVNTLSSQIDIKIQELKSHGQELAKLSNTLNEYRSMLAILEVSTNKTHEWVITVRNDCKKLEELQKVIEEHQKSTLDIINSYGEAVEKQNAFYGEYESKLEVLKNNYINEINQSVKLAEENLNSKIISIDQVAKQAQKELEDSKKEFDVLNIEHKDFASQSKAILDEYKNERDSSLTKIKKTIEDDISSSIDLHKSKITQANEELLSKYLDKLESLNLSKMEEADTALNSLIQSINYLKENKEELDKNKKIEKSNKTKNPLKTEKL